MMSTISLKNTAFKTKSITTFLAVVSAVVLPQIFHAVGVISGTGVMLGTAFLPMQIPVIIAGLLGGPVVGIIAGAFSPLISFAISGMPGLPVLPFIIIELAGYGLTGGFLAKAKTPVFGKLIITQLSGRVLRALAVLAVFVLGNQTADISQIWNMIISGLPGIILQWAFIPLLMYRMEGLKKYYE